MCGWMVGSYQITNNQINLELINPVWWFMICGNSPTYGWGGSWLESAICNLNGWPTHTHSPIHPSTLPIHPNLGVSNHSNGIIGELIKIIWFCLEIYDIWRLSLPMGGFYGLVDGWVGSCNLILFTYWWSVETSTCTHHSLESVISN